MDKPKQTDKEANNAEVRKENQDIQNIPAASEKIENGEKAEKQIKKTSDENKTGKTDNEESSQ